MESVAEERQAVGSAAKTVSQRLLRIVENRFRLFLVEAEEERQRILLAVGLSIAVAIFGLLALASATAIIAVVLWERSPILALGVLSLTYLTIAAFLILRLKSMFKNWNTFAATLDQLRKDRDCLTKEFP